MLLFSLVKSAGGPSSLLLFSFLWCFVRGASALMATTGNWSAAILTTGVTSQYMGGTTSSFRVYKRPALPLGNGSTNVSSLVTNGQVWGTGVGLGGAGLATYGNRTFKTVCSSTDKACYSSCTSIVAPCQTQYRLWYAAAVDYSYSGIGSHYSTVRTTTISHTPQPLTTYSVTHITSIWTTDFGIDGITKYSTFTTTLANLACETSSCEPASRSVVKVCKAHTPGLWEGKCSR